ncbi:MAG TPA: leucine-rich repeat domain-containing protein [Chlamydiales bacterium]|nr:leucine-rich repeat domain-containing protein [Chlamydiales bacterium]
MSILPNYLASLPPFERGNLTPLPPLEGRNLRFGATEELSLTTSLTTEELSLVVRTDAAARRVGLVDNTYPSFYISNPCFRPPLSPFDQILNAWVTQASSNPSHNGYVKAANKFFLTYRLNSDTLLPRFRQINSLSEGIFEFLPQLEYIDLSKNKISYLPETIFSPLTKLTSLSLCQNQISYLPEGIFSSLICLGHLDLSGNRISLLFAEIFSSLSELESLDLSDNPSLSALPLKTLTLPKIYTIDITKCHFRFAELIEIFDIVYAQPERKITILQT